MASAAIVVVVITKPISGAIDVTTGLRLEKEAPRVCAQRLKREDRFRVESKPAVKAAEMIVLLDEVVSGGDHADARLSADVAFETQDRAVGILVEKAEIQRIETLVTAEVT